MATEETRPYQMRVTERWLAKIDDWRRHEPDLPSRAEAIRRLVERGMRAAAPPTPQKTAPHSSPDYEGA